MKTKRFIAAILSFVLLFAVPTVLMAAEDKSLACDKSQLILATGLSNGTYSMMMQDLIKVAPELLCEHTKTSGGPMNVDLLLSRKVDAGLVQDDVLDFVNSTNANVKKKLRALATIHGSALHIIVKRNGVTYKTPGYFGKQQTFVFKNLRELKGQPVVGFASGHPTAYRINEKLTLGMRVYNADKKDEAFRMLDSDRAVAIFAMGGMPIDWLEKLDGNVYNLVTIDVSDINGLGTPFYATKLSYRNLGVMGLNTIAARNSIVVWDYRSEEKAQKLVELRRVLQKNLVAIKEERGTHPGWQDVENLDDTYWPRYEPPANVAAKKAVNRKK